ncbi:GNAT family N-acetyltransferase [Jannaschia sp. W003]|uniref:GNAT family N-acetyltransferase n=1 Tax=Jannaschia sp. W003 TaxID=2867012 RepID=UPI0021A6C207|nr:GNAT family N-acetyltransferase [Jannaschia sp. W003]UWQ21770.1 GNAT family N-acetyltransferase [Jannaschia sp. W003]
MIERFDAPPPEALAIRWRVFVEEQGVPEADELDGTDGGCAHWLLREADGRAVATLRSKVTDGEMHVGRVATLADARGRGHGRALMDAAVAEAQAGGLRAVVLSAQESAVAFYEAQGFRAEGAPYMDAGIPHRTMRRAP